MRTESQLAGYYLSEMAVSNLHGGGLTLQRVLQDDLHAFVSFLHVNNFADVAPIAPQFAGREWNLHQRFPRPEFESRSGSYYLDRVMARLGSISPCKSALHRWCRRIADHVLSQLPAGSSPWLVVPQGTASVLVMNHIWRQRQVPYLTWIMDDHAVRWRNGWKYEPGFEPEFRFHLRNAKSVLVISSAMQQFYRERFGVESQVLFGPADPEGSPAYRSASPGGPVRLAYFGAIRDWQADALAGLAAQLDPAQITLDLFGLQEPPAELRRPAVSVLPPIPAQDVLSRMRTYDGVVIAASFKEELRNLTEFNIATKLSECLASGTVPVIVAPAYSAMVRFATANGGALILSDFGDNRQFGAIRDLKRLEVRETLLRQALATAARECSSAVMRQRWVRAWNPVQMASGTLTGMELAQA